MNEDFGINLEELGDNIKTSDIMSLYFPIMRKVLLMDFRSTENDLPLIKVLSMVSSVEERMRSIQLMRPNLPMPENLILIPWPKSVESLNRLGITEKISDRLAEIKFPNYAERLLEAIQELKSLEEREKQLAIIGKNYQTLWQNDNKS